jgi:NTP pyrophosphatase (non-canonical NTP hydrolase)
LVYSEGILILLNIVKSNQRFGVQMNVKEFQKNSAEVVFKLDKKFSVNRTAQMALSQLLEELGELAKEVNKPALRNQQSNKEALEDEFADTTLQLVALAEMLNIDIEKAVEKKIKILAERHR